MHTISLHVDLGNILMAVYTNVSNCVLGPRGLENGFVLIVTAAYELLLGFR